MMPKAMLDRLRILVVACFVGLGIGDAVLANTETTRDSPAWRTCRTEPRRACILDEALRSANLMASSEERLAALDQIARAQAKLGMKQAAAATINRFLEIVDTFADTGRSHALAVAAGTQAKAGMKAEAVSNLDRAMATLPSSTFRQRDLMRIARGFAEAGNTSKALEIARTTYEGNWPNLFVAIADAQREAGLMSDAKATLDEAARPRGPMAPTMRARFLLSVFEVQIKAGLRVEALLTLETAQQITPETGTAPTTRVSFLVSVSEAQMKAGLRAEALRTLDTAHQIALSIKDVVAQVEPLANVARGSANAGRYKDAAELARSIKHFDWRARAFVSIAEAQAGAGLVAEANATLDEALQWTRRVHELLNGGALGRIGEAQAKVGRIADALAIADSIKGERSEALRIRVLCASAENATR
jgi:tetratricopeptide (TPR) repeat protein